MLVCRQFHSKSDNNERWIEVEKDEDRQGVIIQRKEEGIKERRGRNKQNKRDLINKRPLPYCLWLQHYPLEPSNPHR